MTKEYIKEAYEKLKKKLGRQPNSTEFYENTNVTNHLLLTNGFRTYSQLVEEMGDIPKQFFNPVKSEDDYLIPYGNMVRQLNKIPSTAEWIFYKGKPTLRNYYLKFNVNSWKDISKIFFNYAKDKPEWSDVIHLIPQVESTDAKVELPKTESEECYVYLMYDTKTLCHKIGISNEPEWREKTLQSEKPSIKMIAAKKYRNRRMAANFEKALHDSYSHKRKRGEWFQLDQEDIDEIKDTLND